MPGSLAASEIRVAATGTIYVAPIGTTPPATIGASWDAAWRNLGYATTDGVRIARTLDTEQVNSWQSVSPQRYLITGVSLTAAFDLQQFNKDTLPLYMGGGAIVSQGGGSFKYSILAAPTIDERMFGVEWTDGASITYRFLILRGMVSETGEMTLGREQEIRLPITFSALTSTPDLGYLLTNDTAFA
jgi:hypothetical protein